MKIEVETDEAVSVLKDQLAKYAERVDACRKLFEAGQHKEAYRMFPYRDPVGANLEEYLNQIETR